MDTARARRLIAALEAAPDEKFDIRYFFAIDNRETAGGGRAVADQHTCGTAACIAGWCRWVATQEEIADILRRQVPDAGLDGEVEWSILLAADWLGLSMLDAQELFMPPGYTMGCETLSRARAISVLRRMLYQAENPDSGKVEITWYNYDHRGDYCGLSRNRLPVDRVEGLCV